MILPDNSNHCPNCGYKLDAASVLGSDDNISPEAGDISVCFSCTAFLIYDDDLKSLMLTPDQLLQLPDYLLLDMTRARLYINKFSHEDI